MWPLGTSTGLQRPAAGTPAMRHNKAGRSPRPTPATLRQGRRPGSERRGGQRPRGAGDRGGVGVAGSPPGRSTGARPAWSPRTDGRTDGRLTAAAAPRPASRAGPALTSRAIWFSASSSAVSRSRVGSRLRPAPWVPMSIGRRRGARSRLPLPPPGRPSLRRGVMASAGAGGDAGTQGDGAGARGHAGDRERGGGARRAGPAG